MSIRLKDTIYNTASYASNSDKLDGLDSSYLFQHSSSSNFDTQKGNKIIPYSGTNTPLGTGQVYGSVLQWTGTLNTEPGVSSGSSWYYQLWGRTEGTNLYYRTRTNQGNWTDLKRIAFDSDIPTSLKNPASLTIQANGTSLGSYDGSIAKTFNITYSNVGAAASSHTHTKSQITDFAHTHDYAATSHTHTKAQITDFSHTHNYAGSSSAGGTANAAKKLELVSSGITTTTNDTTANWGPLGTSVHFVSVTGQLNNQPSQYGMILNMTNGAPEVAQLWFTQNTGTLYHRQGNSAGWGCNWTAILDSTNYSTWVAAKSHTHDYAASSHNHDSVYSKLGHTHSYAASNHNHDSVYSKLGHTHSYAATNHSHDYLPLAGGTMTGGNISWNSDSHGVYFYNGCGIEKWSGYGPSLVAESGTDFHISSKSNRATRYLILHAGNYTSYCAKASHTHDYAPSSHGHSYISAKNNYTFNSSTLPNSFDLGVSAGFVSADSGFGSYGSVLTVRTYSGGGGTLQLYAPYSNTYGGSRIKARFGNYDSNVGNSWTSLKEIAWTSDIPSINAGILGSLSNTGTVSWASKTYGIWFRNHYSGHGLGSYRGVLTCCTSGEGFELNSYWCVNPGDGVGTNNLYYRVKRDSASDWGPYARIIDSGNIGSQSVNYANSAGNANTVDGYHIVVGSTGSDASTIYIIT